MDLLYIPVEWKCVTMVSMEQSAKISGATKMLQLFAGNWAIPLLVSPQNTATNLHTHLQMITGVQAYGQAFYGQGVGPIHYGNLTCAGTENTIDDCGKTTNPSCSHSLDVGVFCDGLPTLCQSLGYTECCVTPPCNGNNMGTTCYCDSSCHGFGDCCPGIEKTCPSSTAPGELDDLY